MSYGVKVIRDSIAPHGVRITTIQATFPRFILAELNTHRVFSRNSASSRAIPPETLIQRVIDDPFVPETFNARIKGMGVGAALDDQADARAEWLAASFHAASHAERLNRIGVDKSRVNRLLEPFLWHTALVTSTEWSNFFALRQPDNDDPVPQLDHGAQPEFQIVARMMRDAMRASEPEQLAYGDWHLPYVSDDELVQRDDEVGRDPEYGMKIDEKWANVSAGRCFVVSYDRLDEIMNEDPVDSEARSRRGQMMGHWSPLEHPAVAVRPHQGGDITTADDWHGNFKGWAQLRKFYPNERDYSMVLAEKASHTR